VTTLLNLKIPTPEAPVKKLIYISSIVAAITTLIVGWNKGADFWDTYGWITRSAHAGEPSEPHKDHEEVPEGLATQAQMNDLMGLVVDIKEGQDRGWDRWECDELKEELPDMLEDVDRAGTDRERYKAQAYVDRNRERWGVLNCIEFED
jgi:hypothetical protein